MFNKFMNNRMKPFFNIEGGGGGGATETGGTGTQETQTVEIDYNKIADMLAGKQKVNEDNVLKGYFKTQGLSKEEVDQAIAAFKEQKAKNTPDLTAIQQQAQQLQAQALQAEMEKEALLMAGEIGVGMKLVPYLMKLADVKEVISENKIDKEKLKVALEKVLEDVPQLKTQQEQNAGGVRFGASRETQSNTQTDDMLKAAFGL